MEVLGIMERHSVPTRIMSAANMNWIRFVKMVDKLKKIGLIEETVLNSTNRLSGLDNSLIIEKGKWSGANKHKLRRYNLTRKGQEVLSLFKNLNEKLEGLKPSRW
ncbi:MAG: Winged helix-turn-helix [Thermoproteota archaeon]|nr:Winged helix-turn-helix [Thermoproteota archaeon]